MGIFSFLSRSCHFRTVTLLEYPKIATVQKCGIHTFKNTDCIYLGVLSLVDYFQQVMSMPGNQPLRLISHIASINFLILIILCSTALPCLISLLHILLSCISTNCFLINHFELSNYLRF